MSKTRKITIGALAALGLAGAGVGVGIAATAGSHRSIAASGFAHDAGMMGGADDNSGRSPMRSRMGTASGQAGMGPRGAGTRAGKSGMGRMGMGTDVVSEFRYLTQMIPHHEEAIVAAKQLLAKTNRPAMKAFATDIITTQAAQVDQMKRDLSRWYPGRDTSVDYTPMMRDLSGLSGDELDRAFLEDMIPHHGMAVMMSQQLIGRDLAKHSEVTRLAGTIRDGQFAEIHKMIGWIGSWFGESPMDVMGRAQR